MNKEPAQLKIDKHGEYQWKKTDNEEYKLTNKTMTTTQPKKNLYKKLLAFQQEIGAVIKDSKNPFFNSKYADINKMIETVKPVLNDLGLIVLQPLSSINGQPAIITIIIDADTGEQLQEIVPINYKSDDPQKNGAAITYYRRFALQSLLFLQAEDDDGNTASDHQKPNTAQPEPVEMEEVPFPDEPMPTAQENSTCESCGVGVMKLKEGTSKNGKEYRFYGCSNYPNCRNTVNA